MDDFFPFDADYNDYLQEAKPIRDRIAFSRISADTMLSIPVYRQAEEERYVPSSFTAGDDSKPILEDEAKHLILYKSMVQNVNPDADLCAKSIYGRLNFQVLTNDVPGIQKGHVFPFLEDAIKYDGAYSMYKKDVGRRTGVNWLCDNPFDRYMRQNYMPYLSAVPEKLALSQPAAHALLNRIALMDKGFENLLYVRDGEKTPILNNGSAGEFFRYVREHEEQFLFNKSQAKTQ